MKLQPFDNETQSLSLGDLTIENRLDQLEIYGSLSITRDQAGLALALQLKQLVDDTVAQLQLAQDLPTRLSTKPTDQIDNPFK
ncbi:MAG: hypothetical protein LW731_02825 [Oxalobacteraceae bacterium]|jgi:hypothetical protein|nr:hypothetical protein [Oxalobacteraceae bacterium]